MSSYSLLMLLSACCFSGLMVAMPLSPPVPCRAKTVKTTFPPRPTLDQTLDQILSIYDEGARWEELPRPALQGQAKREFAWLLTALRDTVPTNPFLKRTSAWQEAEAVRGVLSAPAVKQEMLLGKLNPLLAGSHAALWRWGQGLARAGNMPKALRHRWEDLLLSPAAPSTSRGWALRHALCFALSEGDEKRFALLQDRLDDEKIVIFNPYQRAFSMLGGPPPRLSLWSLPEMEPLDSPLHRLGKRFWISPLTLPPPDPQALWIIPALQSNIARNDILLDERSLKEGEALAQSVREKALKNRTYFAPSRSVLEENAFVFFPILLTLDESGMVQNICMGDAAKAVESQKPRE